MRTWALAGRNRPTRLTCVATPSMKSRRDAIADRFENVYRQLGLLGVGGHGALKTAVATFGKTVRYLTKRPVDDVAAIKNKLGMADQK